MSDRLNFGGLSDATEDLVSKQNQLSRSMSAHVQHMTGDISSDGAIIVNRTATVRRKSISSSASVASVGFGDSLISCPPSSSMVASRNSSSGLATRRRTIQDLTVADAQCSDVRYSVLSYGQVSSLVKLMTDPISIHGRHVDLPAIQARLCDLVASVRNRLNKTGIEMGGKSPMKEGGSVGLPHSNRIRSRHRTSPDSKHASNWNYRHASDASVQCGVREVRLNGSGASSILAADFDATEDGQHVKYNDVDLIFAVDLSHPNSFEIVKQAVLDTLVEFAPTSIPVDFLNSRSMKDIYVSKMVKVNDIDRWSLIALGHSRGKSIELKFVDNMRRQYEFSVDSFHIILDNILTLYCDHKDGDNDGDQSSGGPISECFYPTVVSQSMYGDFGQALDHLKHKLIATKKPEEIRGGGLLKYSNLLAQGYRPHSPATIKSMERYMCSRFFIDFPDISQQYQKLENYLYNHFVNTESRIDEADIKCKYLEILYRVVHESTVCLMEYERQASLTLICNMARAHAPTASGRQVARRENALVDGGDGGGGGDGVQVDPRGLVNTNFPRLAHRHNIGSQGRDGTGASSSAAAAAAVLSYSHVVRKSTLDVHTSTLMCNRNAQGSSTSPSPPQSSTGSVSSVCDVTDIDDLSSEPDEVRQSVSVDKPCIAGGEQQLGNGATLTASPMGSNSIVPTYEFISPAPLPTVVYSNGLYYTSYVDNNQRRPAPPERCCGAGSGCFRSISNRVVVDSHAGQRMTSSAGQINSGARHHPPPHPPQTQHQLVYVPLMSSSASSSNQPGTVHHPASFRTITGQADRTTCMWLVAFPVTSASGPPANCVVPALTS